MGGNRQSGWEVNKAAIPCQVIGPNQKISDTADEGG